MAITKLDRKHVPHYIYIIDGLHKRFNGLVDTKEIVDYLEDNAYSISERSLNRALVLREQLKNTEHLSTKIHIPSKITLDAIVKYVFGMGSKFRDLVTNQIDRQDEINEHYSAHRPTDAILDAIFNPKPEKILFLDAQIDFCKKSRNTIKGMGDNEFSKGLLKEFEHFKNEVKDELLLRDRIISDLERKINRLEKKQKLASFVYRFFGGIGLFFVPIDYRELTLNILISDALEGWEQVSLPDILDTN
ncbi:hypothetical protein [Flagellimonas olearia]|uniref:Uncharacterized protein n=1 Tax=Flagellimonas olearia TaxID=552546 RepID=A0A444VJ66_9FLAO|nr:hypothetical protein [Allomuricauda olearia]RYC50827.1 hypothetical protein DN53_17075 [Allomuricauda olearia]